MTGLKERYLYAVVRNLPYNCREGVRSELEARIDEKLKEKCGDEAPTEADLRAVLTEIGTPAEVCKQYDPDAGKVLISAEYYAQYKRWTIIVVCAVVGSMVFSHLLSAVLGEMQWLPALTEMIAKSFASVLSGVGAVTLVFILLQKKGVKLEQNLETLDNLPPVPKKKDTIPVADSIVGIALAVLLGVLLLRFSYLLIIGMDGEGGAAGCYSMFQTQKLLEGRAWIYMMCCAFAAREVLRLVLRKRTVRLLAMTAVCDVLAIAGVCGTFLRPEVVNPALIQALAVVTDETPFVISMLQNINVVFAAVIVVAVLIDLAVDAVRTLRAA